MQPSIIKRPQWRRISVPYFSHVLARRLIAGVSATVIGSRSGFLVSWTFGFMCHLHRAVCGNLAEFYAVFCAAVRIHTVPKSVVLGVPDENLSMPHNWLSDFGPCWK